MSSVRSWIHRTRHMLHEDDVLRSVLRNASLLTSSSGIVIVLSAVQGILTARMLGVALWGVLAVAMSFSTIVNLFLSFRMQAFVVKWVTHFQGDGTARAATAFKLAVAGEAGAALVAFAIVELLAGWGASVFSKNQDFSWIFRSVALLIVLQAGQQSLTGMLQVDGKFSVQALVSMVSQAASICGIIVVYLAGWGIHGVVDVVVGAAVVASALMWTFGLRAARDVLPEGWTRQKLVRFGGLGREMTRFAILGNLRGTLDSARNSADLLILGLLSNPLAIGYYKLASSIAQIANLPNVPLSDASLREFCAAFAARSWSDFRTLMGHGSRIAALWFLPVACGLFVVARPAISLLYGRSFLPAVPALGILLIAVCVDGILYWAGAALLSMGEPGYLSAVSLLATSAKYVLAFLLVPVGGYIAMAAVESFTLVGMNALSARRALQRLRIRESMASE